MKTQYKAIFRLKRMLEKEGIPFYFEDHSINLPLSLLEDEDIAALHPNKKMEHYQICYPEVGERWISVIEGYGTYGSEQDKLEIMGGFTKVEEYEHHYSVPVIGWLTAENVFKRIKNHYEKEKENERDRIK